jgi:hypothetical protein
MSDDVPKTVDDLADDARVLYKRGKGSIRCVHLYDGCPTIANGDTAERTAVQFQDGTDVCRRCQNLRRGGSWYDRERRRESPDKLLREKLMDMDPDEVP